MGRRRVSAHVEFKKAWGRNDCFRVMAILEKGIPDGVDTAHKQTAVETILFLGDPTAAAVLTNQDDFRVARRRFDEFHFRSLADSHLEFDD